MFGSASQFNYLCLRLWNLFATYLNHINFSGLLSLWVQIVFEFDPKVVKWANWSGSKKADIVQFHIKQLDKKSKVWQKLDKFSAVFKNINLIPKP